MQECVNGTGVWNEPRFSVSTFFLSLGVMAALSLIAFGIINVHKGLRQFFVTNPAEKSDYDLVTDDQETKINRKIVAPFLIQFVGRI